MSVNPAWPFALIVARSLDVLPLVCVTDGRLCIDFAPVIGSVARRDHSPSGALSGGAESVHDPLPAIPRRSPFYIRLEMSLQNKNRAPEVHPHLNCRGCGRMAASARQAVHHS